jgi:hypothetical protein
LCWITIDGCDGLSLQQREELQQVEMDSSHIP